MINSGVWVRVGGWVAWLFAFVMVLLGFGCGRLSFRLVRFQVPWCRLWWFWVSGFAIGSVCYGLYVLIV